MRFDRHLSRLMAAMIVMIIAYVTPSAVQAHEGHAHLGHHQAVVTEAASAPPIVLAVPAPVAAMQVVSATMPAVATEAFPKSIAFGSVRSDQQGRGCCPGPCKGTCCGTMSCCVPGILGGSVSLPTLAFGHVVLATLDVDGRPGVGPEALPRPPRTLA